MLPLVTLVAETICSMLRLRIVKNTQCQLALSCAIGGVMSTFPPKKRLAYVMLLMPSGYICPLLFLRSHIAQAKYHTIPSKASGMLYRNRGFRYRVLACLYVALHLNTLSCFLTLPPLLIGTPRTRSSLQQNIPSRRPDINMT